MFGQEVRFDITRNDEPDSFDDQFFVQIVGVDDGTVFESFTTGDPGSEIEAYREAESTPFEQRFAPFGMRWEQEQEARY